MSATICGHERDALTYVLNVAASDHNNPTADPLQSWDALCYRLGPNDVQVDYSTGLLINRGKRTDLDASVIAAKRVGAWFAIHDPAKLAEIMASALRERGITVHDLNGGKLSYPVVELYNEGDEIYIDIWHSMGDVESGANARVLAMPQARAALLRILSLPEGATAADTIGALTRSHADPDELLNTIPTSESIARRHNESNPGRRR